MHAHMHAKIRGYDLKKERLLKKQDLAFEVVGERNINISVHSLPCF